MNGKLHPAAVEFGLAESCAIRFVFASRCHLEFIAKSLLEVYTMAPQTDWVNWWIGIWANTLRLVFVPDQFDFKFYVGLAILERARLRGDGLADYILPCRHKASEHITALNNISLALESQRRN